MRHIPFTTALATVLALAIGEGPAAADDTCKSLKTQQTCESNQKCRWVTPEGKDPICVPKQKSFE